MKRNHDVRMSWEHGGHKLNFEPTRKDALFYLTVKNETSQHTCVAIKRADIFALRSLLDGALPEADVRIVEGPRAHAPEGGEGG